MPATLHQQLQALAACRRPWAESPAQQALLLKSQWELGQLEYPQYQHDLKRLVSDINALESIDCVKTQQLLVSVISQLDQPKEY